MPPFVSTALISSQVDIGGSPTPEQQWSAQALPKVSVTDADGVQRMVPVVVARRSGTPSRR